MRKALFGCLTLAVLSGLLYFTRHSPHREGAPTTAEPTQKSFAAQFPFGTASAAEPTDTDPTRSMDPTAGIRNVLSSLAASGAADRSSAKLQPALHAIDELKTKLPAAKSIRFSDPECHQGGCSVKLLLDDVASFRSIQDQIGRTIKESFDGAVAVSGAEAAPDGTGRATVVLLVQQ